MTHVDLVAAEQRYKAEVRALRDAYGDWSRIPRDEWFLCSERMRAAYCLAAMPGNPEEAMRYYSVDKRIAAEVLGRELGAVTRKKKVDPRQVIESWCIEHAGEIVDANTIAEAADCSYSVALSITKDRPDLFTKQKKGHYLVRNPHIERNAPKPKEESL